MAVYVKGAADKVYGSANMITLKMDLGGTFTNVATELAKYVFDHEPVLAFVEETNVTGAGVRLYVKANGTAWKYVALS